MGQLELGMFTNGGTDLEAAQYRVLAGITATRRDFHHNRLYPSLGELIELTSVVETILANREQYRDVLPKTLTGVDFENKTLTFDAVPADAEAIRRMFDLMTWAMPRLKDITEEGVAMFDFVTQNLNIDEVGIVPLYRDEGYALIPDLKAHVIHVLRYELSLFTADNDQYRAMKTLELETQALDAAMRSPEDVKLGLVRSYGDLPNPATFLLDTDLDFPFEETILPVAKRKLMRHLIS